MVTKPFFIINLSFNNFKIGEIAVASQILLAIKKCFEFYKVSEIYSLSQTSNEPSCRLLKKNNFIPLNTRPKYFKKYIKKISVKYFILKKKNFKKIHFLEKN